MSVLAIGPLPDDLKDWRGTAAEMADKLREVLPLVGLGDEVDAATERLVRYYVTVGVLHAPAREGREALFDASHVGRYLGARKLLRDGWKLPKIAEMLQASAVTTVGELPAGYGTSGSGPATPAMRALERIRQRGAGSGSAGTASPDTLLSGVLSSRSPQELRQMASAWAATTTLQKTTQAALLTELGNAEGRAGRRRLTELRLTPWCTVLLDAAAFAQLPADTADKLGLALAQALRKERTRKGE